MLAAITAMVLPDKVIDGARAAGTPDDVCVRGSGAPGGNRTPDAGLRTASLYPLSYRGADGHGTAPRTGYRPIRSNVVSSVPAGRGEAVDPTRRHARRSMAPLAALGLALVALIGLAGSSLAVVPADYSNVVVGLQPFMTGLDGPVLVTNAGDGSRRLFVVEQRGVIKVWRSGHALSTFLDMRSKVAFSSEQGLLALAFHPDYEHNRKFYVLFTEKGTGDVIVAEYKASTVNRNKASRPSVPAAPPDRPPRQHEPQRRDARLRQEERLPLHLGRRRWRRGRHAEQRPEPRFPARQAPPDRCQRDPDRPRLPDPVEQPVGEEQDGEARDLVATGCAIPGGSRSTG